MSSELIMSDMQIDQVKKQHNTALIFSVAYFVCLLVYIATGEQWIFNIYAFFSCLSALTVIIFSGIFAKLFFMSNPSNEQIITLYEALKKIKYGNSQKKFRIITHICRSISLVSIVLLAALGHFIVATLFAISVIIGLILNEAGKNLKIDPIAEQLLAERSLKNEKSV